MHEPITRPPSLSQSKEQFRLFLEGVKDCAIFMLDTAGRVVSWNPGAEHIFGYLAMEIIGQHFSCFFTPEQIASGRPSEELTKATVEGQHEQEQWHVRKDGTRFWASEVTTALRDENGSLHGFAQVMRDMTDRKQLEEELRRQAEELAEMNRHKDEFLTMLSHELRNPLAPILNSVHVLRRLRSEDPVLDQASTMIERQVRHLARVIDDLLEVTRLTRGRITLRREKVELNTLLHRAVDSVRPLMEERRHTLYFQIPSQPVWLEADPTRLDQIFVNLLNNAAKYTDPGGQIRLTVELSEKEVTVRVRDNGAGIAPKMLPRIFDLFTQADRSLERTKGGLGIGLTLVRSLVQMHGGTVEASSEGLEKGSEFAVRLLLAAEPAPHSSSPAEPPPVRPDSLRILVVDDNVDTADSLALLLRLHGHEVHTAHNGAAALETAQAEHPDVILLDIGLPKLDGYQVAESLRRHEALRDSLLVAVTGYGYEADRQRAKKAGFDHHFVKPVDPQALEQLLSMRRSHRGGI
jgi:PAS domain S-box-containing protein